MAKEYLPVTDDQRAIAIYAQTALDTVETIVHGMSKVRVRVSNGGHGIMLSLLRASADHARASAFLIASNPGDLAASALALHRLQIEQLVRGIFFGLDASPAELDFFNKRDELPERPNEKGKLERLSVARLVAITETKMDLGHGGQFGRMHAQVKNTLNGVVHGGHSLLAYYQGPDGVGCSVPLEAILYFLANSVTLVHFSMAMLVGEGEEQDPLVVHQLLEPIHEAFVSFQSSYDETAARLGLS